MQDELLVRNSRRSEPPHGRTGFPRCALLRLEDFDHRLPIRPSKDPVFDLGHRPLRPRSSRDVLLVGPPGTGKSHLAQAQGWRRSAIAARRSTIVRSSTPCATSSTTKRWPARERILQRYLKPDLLIIDYMGNEAVAQAHGGSICSRSCSAATRSSRRSRPAIGPWRIGANCWATCPALHGDSRPLPAPCGDDSDYRPELSTGHPRKSDKGYQSAHRVPGR